MNCNTTHYRANSSSVPGDPTPVVVCLKEAGDLAPQLAAAGVPLHANLLRSKFDARVLPRLLRIIRAERIRVVCTIGAGDKMFWGRLAGWLARVDGIAAAIHETRKADGRPVIERMNRWLAPLTDAFIAIAQGAADYLVEQEDVPRAKIVVIHNGVDVERYAGRGRDDERRRLGLAPSDVAIVQVAVLRPEKGHSVVLEAARRVVDACPEARFLLVGDGPLRDEIERRRDELGLARHVQLLGRRDDVERVLAAGDVALLASHDRVETFPLAILEAMASGLPAVCTRVGSIREMIDDGVHGRLVEAGDARALAEALVELVTDPRRRREMGVTAQQRARRDFPQARMVGAHEELFLRLARHRRLEKGGLHSPGS